MLISCAVQLIAAMIHDARQRNSRERHKLDGNLKKIFIPCGAKTNSMSIVL